MTEQPVPASGELIPPGRIADAISGVQVHVRGTVQSGRQIPIGSGYAYDATISDGSGQLDLLFLGRHQVPGLGAGARCRVTGRAAAHGGRLVVWNPRYELELAAAPHNQTQQLPATPATIPPTTLAAVGVFPAASGSAVPVTTGAELVDSQSSDLVEAAGHFRIYLGAAAGVGKTCAMLDEGHRRRRRGRDVVIGFVEAHGRPVTEAAIAGLEVIPRKVVDYRGARFEEMDLEAILARRPDIALVDELAHTNIPGASGNEKRWQDVLDLLAANIDVITTVNIQHLESIGDTVEQITGVPVRERVPDAVLRQADQIELVDSSPEQLRRRMLHGNIYPAEKVPQALSNFFREANLAALRELTLRFLADETDDELIEHLRETPPGAVWETSERILVGVRAVPGADAVIRRACRMAARLKADLHVLHVASAEARSDQDSATLAALRRLARDVGAEWTDVRADDPATALLAFAQERQITQIVLGPSRRTRWQQLRSRGSIVKRMTRLAGEAGIDVHIIARQEAPCREHSPPEQQ